MKLKVYRASICSLFTYGSEAWNLDERTHAVFIPTETFLTNDFAPTNDFKSLVATVKSLLPTVNKSLDFQIEYHWIFKLNTIGFINIIGRTSKSLEIKIKIIGLLKIIDAIIKSLVNT